MVQGLGKLTRVKGEADGVVSSRLSGYEQFEKKAAAYQEFISGGGTSIKAGLGRLGGKKVHERGKARREMVGKLFGRKSDREKKFGKGVETEGIGFANLFEAVDKQQKVVNKMKFMTKLGGKIKSFFFLSVSILGKMFMFFVYAMIFFGVVGVIAKFVMDLWPKIKEIVEPIAKSLGEFKDLVVDVFGQFWSTAKTIWGFFTGEKSFTELAFSLLDSLFGLLLLVVKFVEKVFWPIVLGVGQLLVSAVMLLWDKFMSLGAGKKFAVMITLVGLIIAWLYGLPIIFPLMILGALYMFGKWLITRIKDGFSFFANGGTVTSPLQIVGERGPELVNLPRGSRVHSNAQSKRMVSSGGVVNNYNITVNARDTSDGEMRRIANKLSGMINNKVNRTTSSRTMG